MSYPEETKKALVKEYEQGKTVAIISKGSGIPENSIYRWIREFRTINTPNTSFTPSEHNKLRLHSSKMEHKLEIIRLSGCISIYPLKKRLNIAETTQEDKFHATYENAMEAIKALRDKFGGSSLFGNEKDDSFKSSIGQIYQTFGGEELYPSVEEKAAMLLYLVTKNHSFSDGNKRIAATLFLWFLNQNGILYRPDGSKRLADNTLVALTLMIAESKTEEKDVMVKVVVNLINQKNV